MNGDRATVRGTPTTLLEDLHLWGGSSAVAACALNLIWLICMVVLASIGDTAAQVQRHAWLFRLSVGSCLMLTLCQVPILMGFAAAVWTEKPARAVIGGFLYFVYIPINLIAYFSFGSLAPSVYSDGAGAETGAPLVGILIEIGHPLGLIGNLPILGYGVLGAAWVLLASALVGRGKLWSAAAWLIMCSGALSVLGLVGAFIGNVTLQLGCFAGGVVSLPAMGALGAALLRDGPSATRSFLVRCGEKAGQTSAG